MNILNELSKYIKEDKHYLCDVSGNKIKFYHGTNNKFGSFKNDFITTGSHGAGFYFAQNADVAKRYGNILLIAYLKIDNPLILSGLNSEQDLREKYPNADTENKLTQNMIRDGYDGVIVFGNSKKSGKYIKEVVVFNPNQIDIIGDFE